MNDTEKIQELNLNLLKKYIEICEENHLRYYFIGGALIGVLRHKGFIPWDDDIDVGMPRQDYEKFLRILEKNMPSGYGICNRTTDQNWHFLMSQFIDVESEIEINLAEKTRKANIWIDLFPLDGLPTNSLIRWIRIRRILLNRYLIQLANISTQVDSHRERGKMEKAVLKTARIISLHKIIHTERALDRLEKILRKTDFDGSEYAGNMLGRYRKKEAVPTEYFGIAKKGIFEGMEVNIPAKSDELQTALYGDYMKLPSKEAQESHNVKIIHCRDITE